MGYGIIQLFVFALLLCFFGVVAEASSSRTVTLKDGEMGKIFVEQGFTTRIKFDSHPDPGLSGDQDSFKVEYLKNVVAIKPLVGHGETNLFITTKDGDFGFQIVASKGHHDNTVYAKYLTDKTSLPRGPTKEKTVVFVDDISTQKIGRSVNIGGLIVTLTSVARPKSNVAAILELTARTTGKNPMSLVPSSFSIMQNGQAVPLENIFLQPNNEGSQEILILVRASLLVISAPAQIVITSTDQKTAAKLPFKINAK